MRRISPAWTNLYQGYLSVRKSQRLLELEWTRAIKIAEKRIHQRKVQAWSAKIAVELRRQRLLIILTPIVFVLLCVCALLSTLLPWSLLSWGMAILFSFMMLGGLLLQTARIEKLEKNPPPKTAEGRNYTGITEKWWQSLQPPALDMKVDGDRGEKSLWDALGKHLSNQFLALPKLMVLRNLDADVILLGPSGIWLLESKYQSGKIICRDGGWSLEKRYYGKGGLPKKEVLPREPYDEQWLREKEAVAKTIARRLPQEMHWLAGEIRGGLVFTHPRASLEIDTSCRAEYGKISDWVNRINSGPVVNNMTTGVLLCLVDALLENESEISTEKRRESALQLAGDIYNKAENEIPAFVKANL